MTCIRIQQSIYQGLSCNIPFITYDIWKKLAKKYQGLAGIIERLHKNDKFEKEFVAELTKIVPEFNNHIKSKILEGFKSHPIMKMKVWSTGYDSE
jgi:hypothetical protein